jgi:hypothetical protein
MARQDKHQADFKKKGPSHHFEPKRFHPDKKLSKFCSNSTVAQAYLTKILSVIDNLQDNSTYSSIFKSRSANFIAYLKDTTNQGLLKTDCEGFITGLKAAKKSDKEFEREQKKLARTIEKQLKQVMYDLNHGKEFQELDS